MNMNKPQTGPLSLESTDHADQFNISGQADLEDYSNTYCNFGGYFGTYGPHVFFAAPQMLSLLKKISASGQWYPSAVELDPYEGEDGEKLKAEIDALIRIAKGETNE